MTKSRQLDYRNIERRRALLAPRRVVACAFVAIALAAMAFVAESLRRSAAQLGAATMGTLDEIRSAPAPSRASSSLEVAASNEDEETAGFSVEAEPDELEDSPTFATPGPITAVEFAQLVEAGVLRDVDTDPEAAADLRRVLEAAAAEAAP